MCEYDAGSKREAQSQSQVRKPKPEDNPEETMMQSLAQPMEGVDENSTNNFSGPALEDWIMDDISQELLCPVGDLPTHMDGSTDLIESRQYDGGSSSTSSTSVIPHDGEVDVQLDRVQELDDYAWGFGAWTSSPDISKRHPDLLLGYNGIYNTNLIYLYASSANWPQIALHGWTVIQVLVT
jgi:hypothetical protein